MAPRPPLVQIVPHRTTAPEGVGDYARIIAENLQADHDRDTVFIAATAARAGQKLIDRWPTRELARRARADLLLALDDHPGSPVLLHLSAYGFQRRGVPLWLVGAMATWRRRNPGTPLVTVFHEISATGPIWRSAFWLGPWQKHVARRIFRISSAAIATTQAYADILNAWAAPGTPIARALPVFSTIGESPRGTAASDRPATLAIFGRASVSTDLYDRSADALAVFVRTHGITDIVDIGRRTAPPPPRIGDATVRALGESPVATIVAELARARFGALAYDADRLAKSTIFSAYCAHGAIPVCFSDAAGTGDGLAPDREYLLIDGHLGPHRGPTPPANLLQAAAEAWYGNHDAAHTARLLNAILTGSDRTGDPA